MKYGIYVGNTKVNEKDVKCMSDGVAAILAASFEAHADQETTRTAIGALRDAFSIQANITGCNLTSK